jgi:hypothetical protein
MTYLLWLFPAVFLMFVTWDRAPAGLTGHWIDAEEWRRTQARHPRRDGRGRYTR